MIIENGDLVVVFGQKSDGKFDTNNNCFINHIVKVILYQK